MLKKELSIDCDHCEVGTEAEERFERRLCSL
jgi:hypothetical protein